MIIQYKNTNIHFTVTGYGRAIVLLHGFLENLTMWDATVQILSKKYRVICIDLPGHGKTGNTGYIHTMEGMAKFVKAVLNHLGLRKIALIGHSMGGYVSLAFAELFPDNVKGLCLMNSTAIADSEEKKIMRNRAVAAVKLNHKTFVRISIPNLFSENNRLLLQKEIQEVKDEALKGSKQGAIAALEGMKIRKNREHILQKSDFFKLMIIGEQDPVLDYKSSLELAKKNAMPLVKIPGGHMSHIENEIALIKALSGFAYTVFHKINAS